MADSSPPAPQVPALVELVVGDSAESWADAGFYVDHDGPECLVHIGGITIRLNPTAAPSHDSETPPTSGILRWSMAGLASIWTDPAKTLGATGPNDANKVRDRLLLDGLETCPVDQPGAEARAAQAHANFVTHLDHVVLTTKNMKRTLDAFEHAGFEVRRIRDIAPNQQAFLWAGETILEIVGPAEPQEGEGVARLWGLAMTSSNLDGAAEHLGNRLGPITNAVQHGRRIATLRGKDLGVSVPLVLMSDHQKLRTTSAATTSLS